MQSGLASSVYDRLAWVLGRLLEEGDVRAQATDVLVDLQENAVVLKVDVPGTALAQWMVHLIGGLGFALLVHDQLLDQLPVQPPLLLECFGPGRLFRLQVAKKNLPAEGA